MVEPVSASSGFSKRDIAYLLFKRKRQIVAVLLLSVVSTTLTVYIVSRTYVAQASIFVERGAPPTVTEGQQASSMILSRNELLNSEIDFMLSRAVLGKAADELLAPDDAQPQHNGPRRQPPYWLRLVKGTVTAIRSTLLAAGLIDDVGSRDGLIDSLQDNIEAKPALHSNIINVSFPGDDPGSAQRIVNTVTRIYLEERLRLLKRPGLYEFYEEQIALSRRKMRELDKQIRSLKSDSDVVDGAEEVRLKLEELRDLESRLNEAHASREELGQKVETLTAQIAEVPPQIVSATTSGPNPEMTDLLEKLAGMRDNRARDAQVYRRDSQKMRNHDRAISEIETRLAAIDPIVTTAEVVIANDTRINLEAALREAEVEYQAISARAAVLARQMDTLRAELQRIDAHTVELESLTMARDNAERTYLRYVDQQEDARIADATEANMTNVDVIHYAAEPGHPKRARIIDILIGATLGLLMGFAFAFAAEFFDHSLENQEDVEHALGLPLLASLPESSGRRARWLSSILGLVRPWRTAS